MLTSIPDNAYFANAAHELSGNPYPAHQPNTIPGQNFANNGYPNPPQYSGYGQVNYNNTMADQQSMDTRKRAIEALNDFLGDVKRRALDPGAYYDVGQRLNTNSLPLPVSIGSGYSLGSGYAGNTSYSSNNAMDSFSSSNGGISMNGGGGAMTHGPLTQNYSLPMPNARTKTDLLDIDRFLEQLQATVYETSNSSAAAGIQQPGVHSQFPSGYPGFNNYSRSSDSPPNMQQQNQGASAASAQPLASVAQMASMTASAGALDTPALTPASVSSYASSGHSPMSSHSRSSMEHSSNAMYPSLPSVTAVSDIRSGYTSAPPSGLASEFDGFEGRRYSGGRLQREAPARQDGDVDSEAMDVDSDRSRTPRKEDAGKAAVRPGSSSLDPALRSTPPNQQGSDQATPGTSDGVEDKAQEAWVENIRVIETLRRWISERLANKEFDRSGDDATPEPAVDPGLDQQAQAAAGMEKLREHEQSEVAYPTLKQE